MPARKPTPDAVESRLLTGGKTVQRLVAQSASLMRNRVSLHAETVFKRETPENDRKFFQSLYRITDSRQIFKRCRELSQQAGFMEWVLRAKKLLCNHGLEIIGIEEAGLKAEVGRLVRDILNEKLICDVAVAVWKADSEATLPTVNILDSEGVKYENEFGEETLTICYKARTLSEAQKTKLGDRYAEALGQGKEIVWGEGAGEGFAVLSNAKMGNGLGRPPMWAIFEDLAVHGLLVKGDWNAAWTAKDVIRQFKKGHDIKSGNMAGLPVHFLKAAERDAIHKAVADKAGAFDIVTNFDVDVEYPKFDFDFFRSAKYDGVRQRLMEWAGPVGTIYLSERNDDEILFTLLRVEIEQVRAEVRRLMQAIQADENFKALKNLELKWSTTTLASWQAITSYVNSMCGNGIMSHITGRKLLGLDEAVENKNMETQHANPEHYTPPFEPHQAMLTNPAPTPAGGRPPQRKTETES